MISLEQKFDRQPDLKMKYVETINQYIRDGHATKIDINKRNDNFNNKVNYIPHHAVTKMNKPGKIVNNGEPKRQRYFEIHLEKQQR